MEIGICITNGPRRGEIVSIEELRVSVGREAACALQLPDAAVSRHHCEFWIEDDRLFVRDLESSLGTLVNGTLIVEPLEITYNADIQIGSTIVRVVRPTSMPTMLPKAGDAVDPLEALFTSRLERDKTLGGVLVAQGAASSARVNQALHKMTMQYRQKHKLPPDLGTVLVYHDVITDAQLHEALGEVNRQQGTEARFKSDLDRRADLGEDFEASMFDLEHTGGAGAVAIQHEPGTGEADSEIYGGAMVTEVIEGSEQDSGGFARPSSVEPVAPTAHSQVPSTAAMTAPDQAMFATEADADAAAYFDEGPVTPIRPGYQDSTAIDVSDEVLAEGVAVDDIVDAEVDAERQSATPTARGSRLDKMREKREPDPDKEPITSPKRYAHPIALLAALLLALAIVAPLGTLGTVTIEGLTETISADPQALFQQSVVYFPDATAALGGNWLWMALAGVAVVCFFGELFGLRFRFLTWLWGLAALGGVVGTLTNVFADFTLFESFQIESLEPLARSFGPGLWLMIAAGVTWFLATLIRPKSKVLPWILTPILLIAALGGVAATIVAWPAA